MQSYEDDLFKFFITTKTNITTKSISYHSVVTLIIHRYTNTQVNRYGKQVYLTFCKFATKLYFLKLCY